MLAPVATTKLGDTVVRESPIFHGAIALLELLNLEIMELPWDAINGIDMILWPQILGAGM
jgi:DNA-binding transcriptional MocR family regulator